MMAGGSAENSFSPVFWQREAKSPARAGRVDTAAGVVLAGVSPAAGVPLSFSSPSPQAEAARTRTAPIATKRDAPTNDGFMFTPSLEYGRHNLFDAALQLPVVAERPDDGRLAGLPRRHALGHELPGVDQEARAHSLRQAVLLEMAHFLAQLRQLARDLRHDRRLVGDDLRLLLAAGIAELDGDGALAGGGGGWGRSCPCAPRRPRPGSRWRRP